MPKINWSKVKKIVPAPPAPAPVASESAKPLSKKEMRARIKEAKKTAKANKKAEFSVKEMSNEEWFNKLDTQGGVTPKQAKQLGYSGKEIRENLPNRELSANREAIKQNLRENAHNAEQAKFRASREEKHAAKAEFRQRSKAEAEENRRRQKQSPTHPEEGVNRSLSFPSDSSFATRARDIQKSRENIEGKLRAADAIRENAKAAENKGIKGVFNNVKSSVSNLKSSVTNKIGQAEEAIEGFKAKYSSTPTEFQQQTTEMVNKFSGGKYTGAVDTENMNWIEAGANKHLHKSVARDYDNLMAKMQGAKDQEAFSKLMEETGINYKEGMSGAELEKNINAHFDKRIADGPGIANYMLGNRVAGGAMLGVSGASVLALSDSRGRRSNSDLYSSQI